MASSIEYLLTRGLGDYHGLKDLHSPPLQDHVEDVCYVLGFHVVITT